MAPASASAEATGAAATGAAATGAEASASTEPPAGATGALAPAEAAGEAEEGGAGELAAAAELRLICAELQTPGDVLAGGKAEKDASQDVEMTVKDPSAKKFKMKKDNTDLQSRAEVASRWVIWNPDKARPSKKTLS